MAGAAHLVPSKTGDLRSVHYERSLYVVYDKANADVTLIFSQNTERSSLICDLLEFWFAKSALSEILP